MGGVLDVGIIEFQKTLVPFAVKIENIQGLIDGLNQALSREGVNIGKARDEFRIKFLEGVKAFKTEYKIYLRGRQPGSDNDPGWPTYVMIFKTMIINLKIPVMPFEVDQLFDLHFE